MPATKKAPSAAQKKNQARMKKAIKYAKEYREKNPSAKWTDAVKKGHEKVRKEGGAVHKTKKSTKPRRVVKKKKTTKKK